ncbi:hypothetical protein CQ047_12015 [Microbacterium sp. MYb72]|uniref:hypothetical protein n=1 Tax=Microbacterium sp. MYb72 TaxID=1848693 RepID=UPI000CFD900E|nr:hypothetical protein [Microbacterium sp. MYb72]PRB08599.1 hypothetical protein CQ047_12015 [Microbacterium sp. MYb72]
MAIHSEGINPTDNERGAQFVTDADLDRFESIATPIYQSTFEAGKASKYLVSTLGQWVIRLVAEVRRLRRTEVPEPPTRDEREALIAAVQHEPDWDTAERGKPMLCSCGQSIPEPDWDAVYMHRADAVLAAGFRRSEVPEPSAETEDEIGPEECKACGELNTECRCELDYEACCGSPSGRHFTHCPTYRPEPQGEPSDAQVLETFLGKLAGDGAYTLNFTSAEALHGHIVSLLKRDIAALRAAGVGGVR